MEIINNLDNFEEEHSVEHFIKSKVDDLIERSVVEGRKRRQIEKKVADNCGNPNTKDGAAYLSSISDFSVFPKYMGRGIQASAPELDASGKVSTLVLRFADVNEEDVAVLESQIVAAGFEKSGNDYIKTENKYMYTMAVSYGNRKLRIFHKISTAK